MIYNDSRSFELAKKKLEEKITPKNKIVYINNYRKTTSKSYVDFLIS